MPAVVDAFLEPEAVLEPPLALPLFTTLSAPLLGVGIA